MADDFNERLKNAAKRFSQRTTTEEQAQKDLEENRKSFLLAFWDTGHNVIEPVLREAQESLAPPARSEWSDNPKSTEGVPVNVKWSDNDDRLIFSLSPGTKHAVLVFLADPVKMRVRVVDGTADLKNKRGFDRLLEIQEGRGNITARAELRLEEVTKAIVQEQVARFVEENL